jgi:uncharacterized membrane protein
MSRNDEKHVYLYFATYHDPEDAKADLETVGQLHRDGLVGLYDAALITRDVDGQVHVKQTELPTRRGALAGMGIGVAAGAGLNAIAGAFLPPYILAGAVLGAINGGVMAHERDGLRRDHLKELGKSLSDGTAAVVVLAESTVAQAMQKAAKRESRQIETEMVVDADRINREIDAMFDTAVSAT